MGPLIYYGIAIAIFFAAFAMLFREGLWSNTLTLINVTVSGLVAFAYFEPLTAWMLGQFGQEYQYVLPLPAIWAIFFVTMIVLQRLLTGMLSRTRMRFVPQLDDFGGGFMALLLAIVLVCFSFATFHTAALPVDMAGGRFDYNYDDATIQQPDAAWLRLATIALDPQSWGDETAFNANSYIARYKFMRARLEEQKGLLAK